MYGLSNVDFAAIDRAQPMHPSLQQEAERVLKIAEYGTYAITLLQALAAISAATVAYITYKEYRKGKLKSRSSKTHRYATRLNGKRRRR